MNDGDDDDDDDGDDGRNEFVPWPNLIKSGLVWFSLGVG